MNKKIGRNDFCPCGSGLKYKKCCLNKKETDFGAINPFEFYTESTKKIMRKEKVDGSTFFSKFDNNDLLPILALLQVLPENHGKNIRLEEIMKQAIKSNKNSKKEVETDSLKRFIHESFPHNHNEDPPENLFTENIMTPIGNLVVFSGITEGQFYAVGQLINTISQKKETFNHEFVIEALESSFLILSISNYIINNLNYDRNLSGKDTETNDIFFPNNEFINKNKNIFRLSLSELESIASSINVRKEFINDFLINMDDNGFNHDNPDLNPIIFNPILKINNSFSTDEQFIIISPTTIVFACVNNILRKAIKYNCLPLLLETSSKISWEYIKFMLEEIGYLEIEFEFSKTNLPIHEGLFVFDTNKIAYILCKYDNGDEYNPDKPLEFFTDDKLDIKISKRRNEIYKTLISDVRNKNNKLFQINIIIGTGRPYPTSYEKNGENWEVIGFSISDLIVLYKSDKCHNLTLWNYIESTKHKPFMTPFFLDNFSLFIENEESIYIDDNKYDSLMVGVGNALGFKTKAVQSFDDHLAQYTIGPRINLIPVSREKLPALLPIYSTRKFSGIPFRVNVKYSNTDIWIKPLEDIFDLENHGINFLTETCVAIAYWLYQFEERLKPFVNSQYIGGVVIELLINYDENSLENITTEKDLESEIKIFRTGIGLMLILNEHFNYHLCRPDNYAERILMRRILEVFNEVVYKKNKFINIVQSTINELIELKMPLGPKKKLLVLNTDFDIRISPRNVKSIRDLYPYEINKQIDSLGEILTQKPYKPKDDLDQETKKKLINSVVLHFYSELRKTISRFSQIDMLSILLILQESCIQKREHYKFESTPKIECFKEYTDINSIISNENKKIIQHSLAIRCLIEHIIAEPTEGKDKFDVSGIDRALAYMHNIINWGFISDELNFDISDIKISLLPSGRIGTDKTFQTEVIEPFYEMKFKEDIHNRSKSFKNKFKFKDTEVQTEGSKSEFEEAFLSEFQISHENFTNIIFRSVQLAYEEDGSFYKLPKTDFINKIAEDLSIEVNIIEILINSFSLFNRGKVENVSEIGLINSDFYPWRYNRKLSILYKPYILTVQDDIEYIWFGSRILIDSLFFYLTSIDSGRFNATSKKMISYLASINNLNGKEFNALAYKYISDKYLNNGIYQEVQIKPGKLLNSNTDLGDIDILVFDDVRKSIIAIESKDINVARTPYEMSLEFRKFLTGTKSWIKKVEKRDIWLKENLISLEKIHKKSLKGYSYEYIFLTSESIPLPLIKKNEVLYRFISFYDIKRDFDSIFYAKEL